MSWKTFSGFATVAATAATVVASAAIIMGLILLFAPPHNYHLMIAKNMVRNLDEKQANIYDRILKKPSTISSMVVVFTPEYVEEEYLVIQLAQDISIWFRQLEEAKATRTLEGIEVKVEDVKRNKIVWMGKDNHGILTYNENNIIGTIYYQQRVFSLVPLGDGLHAISEIDQSKFGED